MGDGGGGTEPGLGRDWAELTQECLTGIFSRLAAEDLWKGTIFVCKSWLRASADPCLHLVFDLEAQFDSVPESRRWWTPEFERNIDGMLRSAVNWSGGDLREIRVRHCSDWSLDLVAQRCQNLQVLSIKSSPNVTDESMTKIAANCPNLKELDVSYCYEISHESLAKLGANSPSLRILKRNFMNWLDPAQHVRVVPKEYMEACPQDGDSEAAVIAKLMPKLLHLELRFSKLSAGGLTLISGGCPDLEYLDISGCMNVTSRDLASAASNLKKLKDIKNPNFYIHRSAFHAERYGHWRLYDERFQTDIFRI